MAKYDDASWHYEGEFPTDLSNESAATHIGMFLAWCIDNDLLNEEQMEENDDAIKSVKNREMTGAEFVIDIFDEKLIDDDLCELGNGFAAAYYTDGSTFGKEYSSFIDDYLNVFDDYTEEGEDKYETLYHIEDTFENYDRIKTIIDQRFDQWRKFKTRA